MMATFLPSRAAVSAADAPAGPAPITTKSNASASAGIGGTPRGISADDTACSIRNPCRPGRFGAYHADEEPVYVRGLALRHVKNKEPNHAGHSRRSLC